MTNAELTAALRRAYSLGQTYWQQADSENWRQNRKSDDTFSVFTKLVEDTCAALSALPAPREPVALVIDMNANRPGLTPCPITQWLVAMPPIGTKLYADQPDTGDKT